MAIKIEVQYTNATPADSDYPGGSFKNETSPGALDGTPLDRVWGNDWLGFFSRVLAVAGITPSGSADTAVTSQYFNGLVAALGVAQVYEDTGSADTYELALKNGAGLDQYYDGQVLTFQAATDSTGACTVQIGTLGAVDLNYPDGSALTGGEIVAGNWITGVYDSAGSQVLLKDWLSGPYESTMTGNETFTDSWQEHRTYYLNPDGTSRSFNPSGTFRKGARMTVVNSGDGSANINFDSSGIFEVITGGQQVTFNYDGVNWRF